MESQAEYILRSFRLSDSGPSANVLSEPAFSDRYDGSVSYRSSPLGDAE